LGFNYEAARKAGYSDEQINQFLSSPDYKKAEESPSISISDLGRSVATIGPSLMKAGAATVQALEEVSPVDVVTGPLKLLTLGLKGYDKVFDVARETISRGSIPWDYTPKTGRGVWATERLSNTIEKNAPDFLKQPLAGAGNDPAMGRAVKYFDEQINDLRPDAKPGTAKSNILGAIESVSLNIPFLMAGILTRNPKVALMGMSAEQGAEEYGTMRMKGFSPSESLSAATGYGLSEYWTEKIPVGVLLNPKLSVGKRILGEMLSDIPGEMVATMVQNGIIDSATTNPDMTVGELVQDLKNTAIQTAIATPALAGAMQPAVKWAEKNEARMIRSNVENKSYLNMPDGELKNYVAYVDELSKNRPELGGDAEILHSEVVRREVYSDPITRASDAMIQDLASKLGIEIPSTLQTEGTIQEDFKESQAQSVEQDIQAKNETVPVELDVAGRVAGEVQKERIMENIQPTVESSDFTEQYNGIRNIAQGISTLELSPENRTEYIEKRLAEDFGGDTEITLYRGVNESDKPNPFESDTNSKLGKFWSPNPAHAQQFVNRGEGGQLYAVKVKASDLLSNNWQGLAKNEVHLPDTLQQNAMPVEYTSSGQVKPIGQSAWGKIKSFNEKLGQRGSLSNETKELEDEFSKALTDNFHAVKTQFTATMPSNMPDAGIIERLFKTPLNVGEGTPMEAIQSVFQSQRSDDFNQTLLNMIGESDNNVLDAAQTLQRTSPEDYQKLSNAVDVIDKFYQKSDEENRDYNLLMRNLEAKIRATGISEEGIRAWKLDRAYIDRALAMLQSDAQEEVKQLENNTNLKEDGFELKPTKSTKWSSWEIRPNNEFDKIMFTITSDKAGDYGLPADDGIHYLVGHKRSGGMDITQILFNEESYSEDGAAQWWEQNKNAFNKKNKDVRVDTLKMLRQFIATMGEFRGTYAPRVRNKGKYAVRAWREGEGGDKIFYLDFLPFKGQAGKLVSQLARSGWKEARYEDATRLPESIYLNVKPSDMSQFIDYAMERLKEGGGVDPETASKLSTDIIGAIADVMKERGFLQHRMTRSRGVLIEGYETDYLSRNIRYASNLAGGLSKQRASKKAMDLLAQIKSTGKDATLYSYARDYIAENLRNVDQLDRIMGQLKTIASLKYLTSFIRTPLVNLSSFLTTTIPALHLYASEQKVSLPKIQKTLFDSILEYMNVMSQEQTRDYKVVAGGKRIINIVGKRATDPVVIKFIGEVERLHEDAPQFVRDAVGGMKRWDGGFIDHTKKVAFFGMSVTERLLRGATMVAGFKLAYKNSIESGMNPDEAYERAKIMAEKAKLQAHAAYGTPNAPSWTWGESAGAKVMKAMYTYCNYPHQYLQLLYNLGIKHKDIKAAVWATSAPIVLGGATVIPFYKATLWGISQFLQALNITDKDPEKWWWDMLRKHWGTTVERFGRFGLTGLAGFDISGSMGIGFQMPQSITDWLGPVGGVIEDVKDGIAYAKNGQWTRASEMILPRALSDVARAYREATGGVTSREYRSLFNEKGQPYKLSAYETVMRAFGFRSSEIARLTNRQSDIKRQKAAIEERRKDILQRYRSYVLSRGSQSELAAIMKDIHTFNNMAMKHPGIALLRLSTLRDQARGVLMPSKQQRLLQSDEGD
jgi:ribosomal protein S8